MNLLRSLAMALSCFSKVPVPQLDWKPESMRYMMCFFPVVGLVIGLVRGPALSADELSSALAANKDMGHLLVGFGRIGVSAGRTVWRSVDGRCIIGECSDGFL